ncbi:MAG: methyl-accepting chemotaxis protein [Chitinispirillales bacterium]|jgi:methyl-accepting chemotaxis protein|nr:methyl-accepting chemotaxis protein [Chitinispirillales bacterium]
MKLKYKMPLILFVAFVVIIAPALTVFLIYFDQTSRMLQQEMGRTMANVCAETVTGYFNIKITELDAIKQSVMAMRDLDDAAKQEILSQMLRSSTQRLNVTNVFLVFERGAYFSAGLTEPGSHFDIEAFRPQDGGIAVSSEASSLLEEDDDWYHIPQATRKIHLTEPYKWTYPDETLERKMITLSIPMITDGNEFIGVAGIDLELSHLQEEVVAGFTDPETGAYAIMLSNDGLRIAHPREAMLLVMIGGDMTPEEQESLRSSIRQGKPYQLIKANNQTGEVSMITYAPVIPNGINTPMSLGHIYPIGSAASPVQVQLAKTVSASIITVAFCIVVWIAFLLVFMSRVFGKISSTVEVLGKMTTGDGDLTMRLQERGKDELAQMARGLNGLLEKLHLTIKTTQEDVKSLSDASAALLGLSQRLSKSSETTYTQSVNASRESRDVNGKVMEITDEAGRMSANAVELSSTANQMNTNMGSMVGVVEDMNQRFSKMTADVRSSRAIAEKAIAKVTGAKEVMDVLNTSASEIGQFTNIIMGIAQKTNLLALNATVEAARAGDVGKGFAVVAGEVKQLANQSADSANDITRRIESIQIGTKDAFNAINEVFTIITEVSSLVNTISERIELQIQASNELADSANQTNVGVKQVVQAIDGIAHSVQISAQNADNASRGTEIVSENVDAIKNSAEQTNKFSEELKETANMLKNMSEGLDAIVSKFKA